MGTSIIGTNTNQKLDIMVFKTDSNVIAPILVGINNYTQVKILKYELSQNHPNPFNPTTTISYELPTDGLVKLKIFDITGREVMTLVNEYKQAGSYHINLNGSTLSSGIYFYKLEAGEFVETRKMVLLK